MESESTKWKAEASGGTTSACNRLSGKAKYGRHCRPGRGKAIGLIFAVALGPVVSNTGAFGSELATDRSAEVGFELYRGYTIVTKGSIGGLQKLNFIIDTGAVPSVLDTRVARKLGLKGTLDTVSVFSNEVLTEEVVVPTVKLGPVQAESIRFLAQDLHFIEDGLGVRIDAIIGLDVLGGYDFSIDYQSKRIAFELPTGDANSTKTTDPHAPFESGPGFVVVHIQIQSQVLRLMVDTGTNDLVLFAPRVHDRLPGVRLIGVKTKTTMAGEERWPVLELPEAWLGSADLAGQEAVLVDGEAPRSVNLDGLLGVTSLGVKRISFDFEHHTIRWERR